MSVLSNRKWSRPLAGTGLVLCLGFGLVLPGCKRSAPSPEFEQAHRDFISLYGRYLDDAYTRPEMEGVLQQLDKVPSDSSDADEAKALRARIEAGREKAAHERAAQEAASARATAPAAAPAAAEADDDAGPAEAPTGAASQDAGYVQPGPGMSLKELQARFSGCFTPGQDVFVRGEGIRATWQLKDIANCRDRHPNYDSKLLVVGDGKVLGMVDKSQAKLTVIDGGTAK